MSKPLTARAVVEAISYLFMRTGDDATLADIAAHLRVTEGEVVSTWTAGRHPASLQSRMDTGRGALVYGPTRETLRQTLLAL